MEIKTSWFDTAQGHSDFAESERDHYTLWIKIKDRHSGKYISAEIMEEIRTWLLKNHIKYECGRNGLWEHQGHYKAMRMANQYYVGIFPRDESQMNAVKIVWGEYLSSRNLEKTNAMC